MWLCYHLMMTTATWQFQVDLRLGFYDFGISRARRMGIDRVLIHTNFLDILAPPNDYILLA